MNKENIRKELKRLDSLIFEARMSLTTIVREFYSSVTVETEQKYNSVGDDYIPKKKLDYITGRDPGDENGGD
tara:strand:+ start:1018 stop:1233 length:216 start_codon:yes stop_codon:yes gene_type:complete